MYRGYWQGRHALEGDADTTIIASIATAGVKTVLMTDDPALAQSSASDTFDEKLLLELDTAQTSSETIEQTSLATFFAEVIGFLESQREPFLLWVHCRGLAAPWDAPLAMRQSLADDEDPEPLETVDVPSLLLDAEYDPDELLGITQAYAAQVMVLDECLGVLMQAIEQHPQHNNLLTIVTSPRGFPLGEHLTVGDCETRLYGELLHVPLFLWRGDGQGALLRSHDLVQPPDVAATLQDWFRGQMTDDRTFAQSLLPLTKISDGHSLPVSARDRIVSIAGGDAAIRTPAWFLRLGDDTELYRKPDDRWELNEVASRCPEIIQQLSDVLRETKNALGNLKFAALPPLPDELIEGIE